MKQNLADYLVNFFEQNLPKHYKTESIRTTQVQVALDILDFLQEDNKNKILIIEAPVGTGKSFGALIPATIERKRVRNKIIYATATINLQGQLWNEEIPWLKANNLIKNPIYAKGKAHYLCYHKFINLQYNKSPDTRKFFKENQNSFKKFFYDSVTGQRDDFEREFSTINDEYWKLISLEQSNIDCNTIRWTPMSRQIF